MPAKGEATQSAESALPYRPHVLREYSLLADGERGIVVGPHGDFVWMCAPRWHSGAVFSTLVGGQGIYTVTPADPWYVWGGYYEEGSLIWHSRWTSSRGVLDSREALAYPGDPDRAVVLRRVTAPHGPARLRVRLDPRSGFGTRELSDVQLQQGLWIGRSGPLRLRWSGSRRVHVNRDGSLEATVVARPEAPVDLVLEISARPLPAEPPDSAVAWKATERAWSQAVPEMDHLTLARRDARHAYAVMRGLTGAGGGMVAAATTSLPERAESGRNYDYRYAWIRDQCYAGQAVAAAGPYPLLDDAVRFIAERLLADGRRLKPAYDVDGGAVPNERRLRQFRGYPGGGDKVGNRANRQFQLDALGESLLLFAAAARHDHLDSGRWRAVEIAVDAIGARWTEPDAGIWELDNHHWAHSRLMCVAGLRAISEAATASQGSTWIKLADTIAADVAGDCLHPSGRWQRAPDDDRVDAALLLPAVRGAVPASDPRTLATLAAVAEDLGRDGFVYRFRQDDRPLADAEGAFLLCGFVMALAAHQQEDAVGARAWFERNRTACGPPGLLTEEFDVEQRQLRGNFPQAFVHALVLECASRLSRPQPA
jgi:hypothetical protein